MYTDLIWIVLVHDTLCMFRDSTRIVNFCLCRSQWVSPNGTLRYTQLFRCTSISAVYYYYYYYDYYDYY
jgi:hypothetical protein